MKLKPSQYWLITGLVVYGIAAWCSAGYHHPDEHFQLLEFANYHFGGIPLEELPWEFAARIRPGLQPGIAYTVIGGLKAAGIENPFSQVFCLRLLSGWLMWLVIFAWTRQLTNHFSNRPLMHLLLGAALLLWFMPYLNVRFSSENWSSLSLLAGLLLIVQFLDNESDRVGGRLFAGGLLLGLAFFFRFQMAFSLAGVGAWLLYYRKLCLKDWMLVLLGGAMAMGIGGITDYWLYGEWVFTALNYFQSNIVEGKAAGFGTAPWWFYFWEIILTGLPPISLALLLLSIWSSWQRRQHVFVWVIIPFLLAHILVDHKELRFLFPMAFPWVVLSALAWPAVWQQYKGYQWARITLGSVLIVNFLAFPLRSFASAHESMPYFRFLYSQAQRTPVLLYTLEKDPYHLADLNARFYKPVDLQVVVLARLNQLDSLAFVPNSLLLYPKLQIPPALIHTRTRRVYTYFPDWIVALDFNDWQSRSRFWSVYKIDFSPNYLQ